MIQQNNRIRESLTKIEAIKQIKFLCKSPFRSSSDNEQLIEDKIEIVIKLIYDQSQNSNSGSTAIGRLFEVFHGTVSFHYKRMQNQRNSLIGRPPDLNECQIKILCEHIEAQNVLGNPLTIDHINNFIFCKFNVSMKHDTISSNLRRLSIFKSVIAKYQDTTRFEVPLEQIVEYYKRLDELLIAENLLPKFVFKVDESGFQDFCDLYSQYVIAPKDSNEPEHYYAVDRTTKKVTLVGCKSKKTS